MAQQKQIPGQENAIESNDGKTNDDLTDLNQTASVEGENEMPAATASRTTREKRSQPNVRPGVATRVPRGRTPAEKSEAERLVERREKRRAYREANRDAIAERRRQRREERKYGFHHVEVVPNVLDGNEYYLVSVNGVGDISDVETINKQTMRSRVEHRLKEMGQDPKKAKPDTIVDVIKSIAEEAFFPEDAEEE